MYSDLVGKVAIVTGGGRGIGSEVAKALASSGCLVAIADIDPDRGNKVANEIKLQGHTAISIETDIASSNHVEKLVESVVRQFGAVDILINNAVKAHRTMILETSESQWRETLAVNLDGAFFCTRAVARQMIKQGTGGSIINFSSMCGAVGIKARAAYSVTKAGIEALTRCSAVELAPYGIRVNSIAPGAINTESNSPLHAQPNRITDLIPLGYIGETSQVASVVLFLASNQASYITGALLKVDGGWTVSILGVD